MGASAAESAAYDALKRGATQNQAMAVGFWTGLTEVIFEKISLDELFGAGSPTKRRAIIQKALRQSKVEATEELCTEIANRFTDNMLMQEKSRYNQSIAYYVNAEGLSESEAVRHARRDMILDLGAAALGGGLSGFAMGGAKGTADRYSDAGSAPNPAQTGNRMPVPETPDIPRVETVMPKGAKNPVEVYTNGNAQINRGKIEAYIRGKVTLDADATRQESAKLISSIENNSVELTSALPQNLDAKVQRSHNYRRSQEMSRTLEWAGIDDIPSNNRRIVEKLFEAAEQVEEGHTEIISYIEGKTGTVQVVSRWHILENGVKYLATIILKPVKERSL